MNLIGVFYNVDFLYIIATIQYFILTTLYFILIFMKPILVSGIQPSGKLHIGNYLGALKNFVTLQDSGKYTPLFFVADLHSMTEEYEPKEKQKQVQDLILDYLAAGLNPKKSIIFLQSAVPAHSELAWILNTVTPFGELRRMTQFKDKANVSETEDLSGVTANVGLFTYPTLMAADILLYDAAFVPVGDDQLQHLELARTLARKFNTKFGKTFIEPKPLLTDIPRLMSLDDPTKKMSKSRPEGCLFLDDKPEEIRIKLARATTDSDREVHFDLKKKQGISNLLLIYEAMSGIDRKLIEKRYAGKGYAEFKKDLSEVFVHILQPFQKRKREFKKDITTMRLIVARGNKKVNALANAKIEAVKKKTGLI